jgi:uncharacterized protein YggT (Ycf19 family)
MIPGLRLAKLLVWFVHALLVLAVVILGIAFFLQLFNASTTAAFTQWIYRSANVIMAPFRGIFPPVEADNGSVLNFALLFAMLMYGLLAVVVDSLLVWLDTKIRGLRASEGVRPPQPPSEAGTSI